MGKGGGKQFCQVVFLFQLCWLEHNQDRETTWAYQRGEGLIHQDDRAEKSNGGCVATETFARSAGNPTLWARRQRKVVAFLELEKVKPGGPAWENVHHRGNVAGASGDT